MNVRLRKMVGHGAILMLIGLAAGFGLAMSLIGGFEVTPGWIVEFELPSDSRGWARTHTGGLMNGLMVLVFALLFHVMALPDGTERNLTWMLIGAAYANTIFYWAGMFAPSRAVTFGDNRLGETNWIGALGLLPAFIFAFVSIVAMIILARRAFSTSE